MSTTPASSQPSSNATGTSHGTQSSARTGAHGHRKPGHAEAGTDMFSSLMQLLSAGSDVPGLTLGAVSDGSDSTATPASTQTTDGGTPVAEGGSATLAAMLQWAGRPQTDPTNRTSGKGGEGPLQSAPASSTSGTGTPGTADAANPLLQGMKRLERPEALDAQTLAKLAAPAEGPDRELATTAPSPDIAGPEVPVAAADTPSATPIPANALRAAGSSAVRGHATPAGTQALQQAHHAQSQSPSAQAQVSQTQALQDRSTPRVEVGPAMALRSTVTLDERFSEAGARSADGVRGDSPAVLLPSAQGSGAGAGGQPGQGGDTPASGQEQTADSHGSDASPDDSSRWIDDLQNADDERMDAFASPTSLRHASLRVGESEKDAIDIQLTLTGQELDLGFRTDNADVRAALAQHADSDLPDLLRRGGIQLGDVNVSAQNGERGDDRPARQPGREPPAVSRLGGTTRSGDIAAPAPATTHRPPRRDGNRPLDLFV